MEKASLNLGSVIINLALGWFLMAALHVAARSLFGAGWAGFGQRFADIAFFRDRGAGLVNLAIMAGIWVLTTSLWFWFRGR